MKNTAHVDFKDKNLDNIRFPKVNSLPAVSQHLTPKQYVVGAINEISLVRNDPDDNFTNFSLTHLITINLETQAVHKNHVIAKSFVYHFRQEIEQSRRELGMDFLKKSNDSIRNNQDNSFNEYKLSKLDSRTVNRKPGSDNELTIKKYV